MKKAINKKIKERAREIEDEEERIRSIENSEIDATSEGGQGKTLPESKEDIRVKMEKSKGIPELIENQNTHL